MSENATLFLTGCGIGLFFAIVGAAIEYWTNLRKKTAYTRHVPGLIFYVGGILGLMGVAALAISLIVSGSIGPALMVGLGVILSFNFCFVLLVVLWLLLQQRQQSGD